MTSMLRKTMVPAILHVFSMESFAVRVPFGIRSPASVKFHASVILTTMATSTQRPKHSISVAATMLPRFNSLGR